MISTNHLIAEIREKCIAANPDGDIRTECLNHGYDYRPIRLADVVWAYHLNGEQEDNLHYRSRLAEICMKWNLREDDLEQQSESTLTFLAELLREKGK